MFTGLARRRARAVQSRLAEREASETGVVLPRGGSEETVRGSLAGQKSVKQAEQD